MSGRGFDEEGRRCFKMKCIVQEGPGWYCCCFEYYEGPEEELGEMVCFDM